MLFSNLTELGGEVGGSGGNNLRGIGWWDWEAGNVNGSIVQWGGASVVSWGTGNNVMSWSVDGTCVSNKWSSNGSMSEGNGSSSIGNWGNWSWANWEVGGSNTESVDWVSNIVHALDQTVSINVTVSSTDNTIGGLALGLGGWTSSISIGVLAKFILSVVLGSMSTWGNNSSWSNESSLGDSQSAGENNEGLHFVGEFRILQKPPQGY